MGANSRFANPSLTGKYANVGNVFFWYRDGLLQFPIKLIVLKVPSEMSMTSSVRMYVKTEGLKPEVEIKNL